MSETSILDQSQNEDNRPEAIPLSPEEIEILKEQKKSIPVAEVLSDEEIEQWEMEEELKRSEKGKELKEPEGALPEDTIRQPVSETLLNMPPVKLDETEPVLAPKQPSQLESEIPPEQNEAKLPEASGLKERKQDGITKEGENQETGQLPKTESVSEPEVSTQKPEVMPETTSVYPEAEPPEAVSVSLRELMEKIAETKDPSERKLLHEEVVNLYNREGKDLVKESKEGAKETLGVRVVNVKDAEKELLPKIQEEINKKERVKAEESCEGRFLESLSKTEREEFDKLDEARKSEKFQNYLTTKRDKFKKWGLSEGDFNAIVNDGFYIDKMTSILGVRSIKNNKEYKEDNFFFSFRLKKFLDDRKKAANERINHDVSLIIEERIRNLKEIWKNAKNRSAKDLIKRAIDEQEKKKEDAEKAKSIEGKEVKNAESLDELIAILKQRPEITEKKANFQNDELIPKIETIALLIDKIKDGTLKDRASVVDLINSITKGGELKIKMAELFTKETGQELKRTKKGGVKQTGSGSRKTEDISEKGEEKRKIKDANNFKDLEEILDSIGEIEGSDGQKYTADDTKKYIISVVNNFRNIIETKNIEKIKSFLEDTSNFEILSKNEELRVKIKELLQNKLDMAIVMEKAKRSENNENGETETEEKVDSVEVVSKTPESELEPGQEDLVQHKKTLEEYTTEELEAISSSLDQIFPESKGETSANIKEQELAESNEQNENSTELDLARQKKEVKRQRKKNKKTKEKNTRKQKAVKLKDNNKRKQDYELRKKRKNKNS